MIEWISNWTEGIIIAVIIGAIIEMILPEGTSKKYIKVVIGIYILFTIISPMISKFSNGEMDLDNIINIKQYEQEMQRHESVAQSLEDTNQNSIKQMYVANLSADIKEKLSAQGYEIKDIQIKIQEDKNYTIERIQLNLDVKTEMVEENQNNTIITNTVTIINEINISVGNQIKETNKENQKKKSNISKKQIEEIQSYLSQSYGVPKKNIEIE